MPTVHSSSKPTPRYSAATPGTHVHPHTYSFSCQGECLDWVRCLNDASYNKLRTRFIQLLRVHRAHVARCRSMAVSLQGWMNRALPQFMAHNTFVGAGGLRLWVRSGCCLCCCLQTLTACWKQEESEAPVTEGQRRRRSSIDEGELQAHRRVLDDEIDHFVTVGLPTRCHPLC